MCNWVRNIGEKLADNKYWRPKSHRYKARLWRGTYLLKIENTQLSCRATPGVAKYWQTVIHKLWCIERNVRMNYCRPFFASGMVVTD